MKDTVLQEEQEAGAHDDHREPPRDRREPTDSKPEKRFNPWLIVIVLVLALAGFAALAVFGTYSRTNNTQQLQQTNAHESVLRVAVITPEHAPDAITVDLPGQTQAFIQAPIYAQTNGYLKKWYFDIGSKVKAGTVLAEIDTPQVDQNLDQARATAKQAQAALDLSRATYLRYQDLLQKKVVSQQDFDNQAADLRVKQATFNADEASVRSLEALENFKILRAPFDGIVTARNTDIGALINAGSGTALFTVAQTNPLRVYVSVPESQAEFVKAGDKADLSFNEFPNRSFVGTVTRTAGAIDVNSRTLLTELEVPNPSDELFPGAYTIVHLHTERTNNALLIPANTLLFRSQGAQVGVVDGDSKVSLKKIKIGRDLGTRLEISEGLNPDDRVIVNPSDGLEDGQKIELLPPPKSSSDQKSGEQPGGSPKK